MLSALYLVTVLVAGQPMTRFILRSETHYAEQSVCQKALAEGAPAMFAVVRKALQARLGEQAAQAQIRIDAACKADGLPV